MAKYKHRLKHLEEELRGTKKRLNSVTKASIANHAGMMYWKSKYNDLKSEFDMIHDQFHDSLEYLNLK